MYTRRFKLIYLDSNTYHMHLITIAEYGCNIIDQIKYYLIICWGIVQVITYHLYTCSSPSRVDIQHTYPAEGKADL